MTRSVAALGNTAGVDLDAIRVMCAGTHKAVVGVTFRAIIFQESSRLVLVLCSG